jgi:hypothetical protein
MVEGLTVGGSTPGRIRSGFHRMAHAKRSERSNRLGAGDRSMG